MSRTTPPLPCTRFTTTREIKSAREITNAVDIAEPTAITRKRLRLLLRESSSRSWPDFIYAIYYIFVSKKKAFMASNAAVALYLIGSFSTIAYLGNYLYLVPIILGSYIGTYIAVKYFSDIK